MTVPHRLPAGSLSCLLNTCHKLQMAAQCYKAREEQGDGTVECTFFRGGEASALASQLHEAGVCLPLALFCDSLHLLCLVDRQAGRQAAITEARPGSSPRDSPQAWVRHKQTAQVR